MSYLDIYDERQRQQIEWCRLYADKFNHGDIGHNDKMIIAQLSRQLESVEECLGWLLDDKTDDDRSLTDYVNILAGIMNMPGIK